MERPIRTSNLIVLAMNIIETIKPIDTKYTVTDDWMFTSLHTVLFAVATAPRLDREICINMS